MLLHEFIVANRAAILQRTTDKAAHRASHPETDGDATSEGVPFVIDQLVATLRGTVLPDDIVNAATRRGVHMHRSGYTVAQVVRGYGDVCQAVTELAMESGAPITVNEFHTLNLYLDEVIADAVTEYQRTRDVAVAARDNEQLGNFAHELRNRINTATLSFSILRSGTVPIGGSTGGVLERSLIGIAELIDVALSEVRLAAKPPLGEHIMLAQFIEEVEVAAVLEAQATTHRLRFSKVSPEVMIRGDRHLLAAAVANLLQNAFKYTPADGLVTLRARVTHDAVWIDVEDECGGLPPGKAEELFSPFIQRGADRSGLGLGLSIAKKAVELNGGELSVRDIPGVGCVFTVKLPRTADFATQSPALAQDGGSLSEPIASPATE